MQQIDFYCKKCKCSTRISYFPSGEPETPVMTGIMIKCHTCKRVMTMKKFTEGMVVAQARKDGKVFI